eukprot:Lithocolla_globosa_v1_NODE_61_length_7363_cov_12.683498.p3 type:complete len:308 gc:universal NODE_61_length_7363_cov_12.683498:1048-1971(+)
MSKSLRWWSVNVGCLPREKVEELIKRFEEKKVDFLLLQEIGLDYSEAAALERTLRRECGLRMVYSVQGPQFRNRGVAVIYSEEKWQKHVAETVKWKGNIVSLVLHFRGLRRCVVQSVYIPGGGRERQEERETAWNRMIKLGKSYSEKEIRTIIGGDLNMTADPSRDRCTKGLMAASTERGDKLFRDLAHPRHGFPVVDFYRERHPDSRREGHTRFSLVDEESSSRIDYFLGTPNLFPGSDITVLGRDPVISADHCILQLDLPPSNLMGETTEPQGKTLPRAEDRINYEGSKTKWADYKRDLRAGSKN